MLPLCRKNKGPKRVNNLATLSFYVLTDSTSAHLILPFVTFESAN